MAAQYSDYGRTQQSANRQLPELRTWICAHFARRCPFCNIGIMNDSTIVVAGATGNLGGRIARALLERGASVRALVRHGTARDKLERLQELGVTIASVDLSSASQVAPACSGASCVVSALAGLRDVIVETQTVLLDAAIKADVPRFIPSDYSIDFTKFPPERIAISTCAGTSTSASTKLRFERPRSSTVLLPIC